MKTNKKYYLLKLISLGLLVGLSFFIGDIYKVSAAPVTFTVNSAGDATDQNTADGVCETATPGECTLRAAIMQANENGNPSDQDVIEFDIPGEGPHKITIGAESLTIFQSLFINGYTQDGAFENTASFPDPFNGTLMIEVEGVDTVSSNGVIAVFSDNVSIRGLVVNSGRVSQILTGNFSNITISGNYIGTDIDGMTAVNSPVNGQGEAILVSRTKNLTIGGASPEERNVITSYEGFSISDYGLPFGDPNVPNNIVVQGNNFFVGSDSTTPLPPGADYGGITVRNAHTITLGGDNLGEGNLVENTKGAGIQLSNGTSGVVIAGNRIVGSGGRGISLHTHEDCCGGTEDDRIENVRIGGTTVDSRNIISNSAFEGIVVERSDNVEILGNYIGAADDGVTALGNTSDGIVVRESQDITIGSSAGRNVIVDNGQGIFLQDSSKILVQNNSIGVGADGATLLPNRFTAIGIDNVQEALIGGTSANQGNLIRGNGSNGISLSNANTNDVSILGNSIYDNAFTGIDFYSDGVTNNDELDIDAGANDLLNFPQVFAAEANGSDTDISYYLDVPTGDYRIEFFSNDVLDDTGHGEGQTYIGSQLVTSAGTGQQMFTATVSGDSHSNVIATATEINTSTFSGFGPTSEFGNQVDPPLPQIDVGVTKTLTNPEAVAPGATLSYDFVFTNQGPDTLDLADYGIPFDTSPIVTDYLHPDLVPTNLLVEGPLPGSYFIDSGNADLTCLWGGPGSIVLFGETVSTDYSIIVCWFTGGDTVLAEGETVNFSFDIGVDPGSDLDFANYALSFPPSLTSEDPDQSIIEDILNDYSGDVLSAMRDERMISVNNTSIAYLPADVSVDAEMLNPEDFALGATIYYDVTLTNKGPAAIVLADYSHLQQLILAGAYAAESMTLIGATDAGMYCTSAGPGSIAYWGAFAEDHDDYQLYLCIDNGSGVTVPPGGSYTIRLEFMVDQESAEPIGLYTLNYSVSGDQDAAELINSIANASNDILDTLENDNFARVLYPLDQDGDGGNGGSGDNNGDQDGSGGNGGTNSSGNLSDTGENIKKVFVVAITLLVLGSGSTAAAAHKRRTQREITKPRTLA